MHTTTNQVRNVLMNELGLTRDSVRLLMEQIVLETLTKKMESLETSGTLDRIVQDAFDKKYRGKNCYENFSTVLHQAAAEAAKKFVTENITIKPTK